MRDMGPILAERDSLREKIVQQSESIRYWQEDAKNLDKQNIIKRGLIDHQIKEIQRLIRENERMLDAIKSAHLSLTWSNTENHITHAIWHLEQVLPQAIETNEQPSPTGAAAEQ